MEGIMSAWRIPEDFRALPYGRKWLLGIGGAPLNQREAGAQRSYVQWTRSGGALVSGLALALGAFVGPLVMGAQVHIAAASAITAAVMVTGLRLVLASAAARRADQFLNGTS
jgi:hypothetical protein